jgi:NAD(P)-dependent dehydrogenase (short-subunit alcohol dehydrogenase family)
MDRQHLRFDSTATYLITGGLGGLGRSVSTWMAERGARSIIFLSRRAGKSAKDDDFLHELKTLGCRGIAVAGRAEVLDDVRHAVSQAPSPIRGVIHLAMVQREGMGVDLSHDDWQAAVRPKVDGAWNLHDCFADTPLDFFVMTSSVLTIGYQPGESNYGAASSFLEAFSRYRRGLGLPSSTLVVSALAEVGYIEENPVAMRKVRGGGYYFLAEREFLDFMEYSIRHQKPEGDQDNNENSAGLVDGGYVAMAIYSEVPLSDPQCRVSWRRDARLGSHHNLLAENSSASQHLFSTLGAAADLVSRARVDPRVLGQPATVGIVATEIGRRVQTLMMQGTEEDVDVTQTLQQVGVDSLMAVELRRWWKLVFGVNMTTLEIMSGGTLSDLGSATLEKMKVLLGSE